MLNLLPKGIIINNIVDTLVKDPEDGVVKLLETARSYVKSADEQAILSQVIAYYTTSPNAKMQIRNLVYNSTQQTLTALAEVIYEALQPPINVNFLKMMTIGEASSSTGRYKFFPVIDLKNLGEQTCGVLANLKERGQIFFATIAVTAENYTTVTSDEVIITLIRNGVRAIFYRGADGNTSLVAELNAKIAEIRNMRPILAFYMQKDAPLNGTSLNYIISETVAQKAYQIKLKLN